MNTRPYFRFFFHKKYFLLAAVLFIVEVLIARYLQDRFIRPYGGDYLVVMLVYCFIRAFVKVPVIRAAMGTLLFAYLVEVSQYLNLVTILGLQEHRLASVVLGHSFEWADMLAYTLGIVTVVVLENMTNPTKIKNSKRL